MKSSEGILAENPTKSSGSGAGHDRSSRVNSNIAVLDIRTNFPRARLQG